MSIQRFALPLCSALLLAAASDLPRAAAQEAQPAQDTGSPAQAEEAPGSSEPAQAPADAAPEAAPEPAPEQAVEAPAEVQTSEAPAEPASAPTEQPQEASAEADVALSPEAVAEAALEQEATEPPAARGKQEQAIEVTIAGTRVAKTPGSAHVLRREDLERFEHDDPQGVLLQVPGVYIRQEDGVGLRPNIGIRGTNPDRSKKLTLTEDGVLFGPAPYSAPAAYYFPLMTRMAGVQVLKGPAAISKGPQTIGGAIDFISAPVPNKLAGSVDLAGGQYGYGKAHARLGAGNEQFGVLIEGVHLQNSGFMELPSGANTGSKRNDWMVKTRYLLDPDAVVRHEFGIKLAYADEVSNESYLGLSDADFRDNPYRRYPAAALDKMTNHRTSVVASHTVDFTQRALQIKTQAYRHDYTRSWRKVNQMRDGAIAPILLDPEDFNNAPYYGVLTGEYDSATPGEQILIGPNHREFVSQGVQSVLTAQRQTGSIEHRIEAGLRLHHDSIDRRHTQDAFRMEGGKLALVEDFATQTTADNRANSYAAAMHIVDAMTFRALTLTPGTRIEVIEGRTEDRLSGKEERALVVATMPGMGAFYALTEELGLLAGVYRGFSPPPPASKNKPEYATNLEFGARYSRGRTRIEAIGFYNAYRNITSVCTVSSGCSEANLDMQYDGGKARIYGVEAYASHTLQFGPVRVPLLAAYTFTRGEFREDFLSQDPIWGAVKRGDEMPYLPRHQLSSSIAVETKRAGGAAAVTYVAPMREEPGQGSLSDAWKTDKQVWVDLEAHVRIVGPFMLYANLRNVANAQNIVARRPYGARVNAPRWLQIGAKAHF